MYYRLTLWIGLVWIVCHALHPMMSISSFPRGKAKIHVMPPPCLDPTELRSRAQQHSIPSHEYDLNTPHRTAFRRRTEASHTARVALLPSSSPNPVPTVGTCYNATVPCTTSCPLPALSEAGVVGLSRRMCMAIGMARRDHAGIEPGSG